MKSKNLLENALCLRNIKARLLISTIWRLLGKSRHCGYAFRLIGKSTLLRLADFMQRNLSLPSTVGFASSVMASWEALLALYGLVLATGGPALAFWAFIIEVCGMTAVYASLAELVSM